MDRISFLRFEVDKIIDQIGFNSATKIAGYSLLALAFLYCG